METVATMTGHVGTNVDHRVLKSGVSRASFRLASTPRTRRDGEWQDLETTWLTVLCYRGLADNVKASVGRGQPVIVDGRIRTERWVDDQNVPHERMVLEATTIGHDLTRGTAVFTRPFREAEPPEPEDLEGDLDEALAGQEAVVKESEIRAA